jgi:signal peptidase I
MQVDETNKKNNSLSEIQCKTNYSITIHEDLENTLLRIPTQDIIVTDKLVTIKKSNLTWAVFSNSSSMLPTLNHNTKAIEIKPNSISDLYIGDIISYSLNDEIIIHRIVNIGYDASGFYAVTKGDNNILADPNKVRFHQIQGIVIALIY